MPVKKVGKSAYKWGDSGKVFRGPAAKKKAMKQGVAAYAAGYKDKKKK